MSAQTQILSLITKNVNPGSAWQLLSQSAVQAKNIAKYTGSVLFGSWDKLNPDASAKDGTVALLKLGGGALLGIWSGATMFRNYEEGRAVLTNTGNQGGSAVWSYTQALLQLGTCATTVTGMLMPNGVTGMILRNTPVLAVLPALIGLGMDHFQSLATCTLSHPLAKIAQFGLDNYLINFKSADNPGGAFRSTMLPWWSRNIQSLDNKVFNSMGIKYRQLNPFTKEGQVSYA